MFQFTEGQINAENFLVCINDLLSSGEIADLFQQEPYPRPWPQNLDMISFSFNSLIIVTEALLGHLASEKDLTFLVPSPRKPIIECGVEP